MKGKNLYTVLLVLFTLCVSVPSIAQTGGRKKEHRNQRSRGKLFNRPKSGGHADAFARGNKKGFFARIFKGGSSSKSAWSYKRTNPGVKQNREQAQLFKRTRTKNKTYRDGILASQNKRRSGSRGGHNFSKKKR